MPIRSLLLAVALLFAANAASATEPCPAAVPSEQIALNYEAFDAAGWRDLLARGCTDAAVTSLESYESANQSRLSPDQALELRFHVGQALAMSGRDDASIAHFERARGGDDEWNAYVGATVAFLRRDTTALAAARAQYSQASRASSMRLAIIDGFIACPDRSYVAAVQCGLSEMHQ